MILPTTSPVDVIAKELDEIMDSYGKYPLGAKTNGNEEKHQDFLARFESVMVHVIKPIMDQIGEYMESKGHAYMVRDKATIYDDNPSIKMEIYPRSVTSPAQEREFPRITFIAEPDIAEVGIEVQDGMPGRPGLTRGHASNLESLTPEYVRDQIIYLIKRNFRAAPV
jgi:hypothetical protein